MPAASQKLLAELHAQLGEPERAAELLGWIVRHPGTEADTRRQRIEPLWGRLLSELGHARFEQALRRFSGEALESSLPFGPPGGPSGNAPRGLA